MARFRKAKSSRSAMILANHSSNQTGSGMYHPIVKEQVLPGQLEGLQAIRNYSDVPFPCQAISANPQAGNPPRSVGI
jgi:hypothetical protein